MYLKSQLLTLFFRTLAQYEHFLLLGWLQVHPNMLTVNMEREADRLRYPELSFVAEKVEWEKVYSKTVLQKIKQIIYTFNYVNPKLLLIVTALEEALGHRPIKGEMKIKGFIQPGVNPSLPKINLINIPLAPPTTYNLLMDIINTHHAYDSASEH